MVLSLILQSKLSIESSKGIYPIYLFPFPFLIIHIITNDFPTTNQLNKINKYINLGDLIAVSGPIDSVLGSVDLLYWLLLYINYSLWLFFLTNYYLIFHSKFSQCIISGRDSMLIALLITAVSGCIVRGHHTFMVGFDLFIINYSLYILHSIFNVNDFYTLQFNIQYSI